MPERRTAKNQQNQFSKNGQIKLNQVQYSFRADAANRSSSKRTHANDDLKPKEIHSAKDLFSYDVKLIFNDLRKTVFITIFIIVLLLVITLYLKR